MTQRRLFTLGILTTLLIAGGVVVALPAFAQGVNLQEFAAQAGFAQADIRLVIARLIRTAISFLGILVLGFILYGGFIWMTAGGDAERVGTAKRILTNAVIGLVIVFASFAITQFVLSSLTRAIGGTVGTDGTGGGGGGFYQDRTVGSRRFRLQSWNDACGGRIRNLQLQFVFTQPVSTSSVTSASNPGIEVKDRNGARVDGTFAVSGKTVTFTPAAECPGTTTERCFSNDSPYTVEFKPTVLRSSTGRSFECGGAFGSCVLTFATGRVIDTGKPTFTMTQPDAQGDNGVVGDIVALQARAQDDGGVSLVQFFAGSATAVYIAGLADSTAKTLAIDNDFSTDDTEWNTIASAPGSIKLWASGADCAGHTAVSPQVTFALQSPHCANGAQDGNETGVDCGGDCAACAGGACRLHSECAPGLSCKDGTCQSLPRIDRVSPGNGAVGNLVTISGVGFGAAPGGTVVFLGDSVNQDDNASVKAYGGCSGTWSPTQIVVQVPTNAVDGALEVRVGDASDRTDDAFGARINFFDINTTVRPGICSINPKFGEGSIPITVAGNNFGSSRGNGSVYFGDYAAAAYAGVWTPSSLDTTVPLLNEGSYPVQVFVGDNVCAGRTTLCRNDAECAVGGIPGTCILQREGSNTVNYRADKQSEDAPPVIFSVESGWRVCSVGSEEEKEGKKCSADTECGGTGVCAAASNWGPPGQYVTILGNNFGTAVGTVRFESKSSGDKALGDTLFPEQCSVAFWSNTSIIVKVPKKYTNDQVILNEEHNLVIVRGAVESESVKFTVLDDTPGPGICGIDPSAGPEGTEVTIVGEQFVGEDIGVRFHDNKPASTVQSIGTNTVEAVVPAGAKTGPLSFERATPSPTRSNAVPFTVGNCQTTPNLCKTGELCCADGSCDSECPVARKSHYAYRFSTGAIPVAPRVLVACNAGGVASPTPWEGWSKPEKVCVNAAIGATFNIDIETSTLTENVVVKECTDKGEDPCKSLGAAMTGALSTSNKSFSWNPTSTVTSTVGTTIPSVSFKPDTTYQVTLGAKIKSKSKIVGGVETGLVSMGEDFVWRFRTAPNNTPCKIGAVIVNPDQALADEAGHKEPYKAEPMSADDRCVQIQCALSMGTIAWSTEPSDPTIAEFIGPETSDYCGERVQANKQPPENDVKIRATITSGSGQPSSPVSDTGTLTIDFTDPNVSQAWPRCNTACINTEVGATFNTVMDSTTINKTNVKLYRCVNEVCVLTNAENTEVTNLTVAYVSLTKKVLIELSGDANFARNTFYRVVLSGAIRSASGVKLADANAATGGNYTWVFRTRNSTEVCAIDRIDVLPQNALMSRVDDRQEFEAVAYGAPDDCAVAGQPLRADQYTWDPWFAEDKEPERVAGPQVATMLEDGSILRATLNPLLRCASQCLNAGATVTTNDAFCGDRDVEEDKGEDCDDGNIQDGDGCSARCLTEPSLRCGKFCTGTNNACEVNTDCSAGKTCDTRAPAGACCGNGRKEGLEECDAGAQGSAACSLECLKLGSTEFCGNGVVDGEDVQGGGEECDDGNTRNGDGCSSQCLREGAIATTATWPVCGNFGVRGRDYPEPGEDCDDGNTVNGDGCSAQCLNEGTAACVYEWRKRDEPTGQGFTGNGCTSGAPITGTQECVPRSTPCCGNGRPLEVGEDCDDGNVQNGDGCSARCLFEGSSVFYGMPSFCGDGVKGAGEECEVSAHSGATLKRGPYGVAQISVSAPQEVDPATKRATANVSVTSNNKKGEASLSLQCACTTDLSCGASSSTGCGTANCCFERPAVLLRQPVDGPKYCRNTAVSVSFSKVMDPASFDPSVDTNKNGTIDPAEYQPNLYLELLSINGQTIVNAGGCPTGEQGGHRWTRVAGGEPTGGNAISRAWQWLSGTIQRWFGAEDARAADEELTKERCLLPVTYTMQPASNGSKVYLNLSRLLAENGRYRLVVIGDSDLDDDQKFGVRSIDQVTLNGARNGQSFSVGTELCLLTKVEVTDQGKLQEGSLVELVRLPQDLSQGFFTRKDERHRLTAATYSNTGEEIRPVTGVYDWTWSWKDNIPSSPADKDIVITETGSNTSSALVTAAGNNGDETVFAVAEIQSVPAGVPKPKVVGGLQVQAFLCENPATIRGGNAVIKKSYIDDWGDKPTWFSFFYCRDAGEPGRADDLPNLSVVEVPAPLQGLYKELLFSLSETGTGDGLGVRVVDNPNYLPPDVWYAQKGFKGSPTPTTFDGYPAVQDGTTLYVFAPNSKATLHPNIYVISYNPNAKPESKQAFEKILKTWKFNQNISRINLCKAGSDYQTANGALRSCSADVDCRERCVESTCTVSKETNGNAKACSIDADCPLSLEAQTLLQPAQQIFCDADKAKLRRDTKRLSDLTRMKRQLDAYGVSHKVCSVTKTQSCVTAAQCPGGEQCVPSYPPLESGSYLRAMSVSLWPSWSAALGNAVGSALPRDPLNVVNCPVKEKVEGIVKDTGYDGTTCFNTVKTSFTCGPDSHVYGFRASANEGYTLNTQLEYKTTLWDTAIDQDEEDASTLVAEYYNHTTTSGDFENGFARTSAFCTGVAVGQSAACGDGVKAVGVCLAGTQAGQQCTQDGQCPESRCGEICEVGEVKTEACTTKVCDGGVKAGATCGVDTDCPSILRCVGGTRAGAICTISADCPGGTSCSACSGGTCSADAYEVCVTKNGLKNVTCINDQNACRFQSETDSPSACVPFACGNGVVDIDANPAEECDQGARNGTYGARCTSECCLPGSTACTRGQAFYCGDGEIAGAEQCDCGRDGSTKPDTCLEPNGQYSATPVNSCSFDCRKPGPSCGDGEVQTGEEECDGNTESTSAAVDNLPACPSAKVCIGGTNAGSICTAANVTTVCTGGGTCSEITYQTSRTRTCNTSCGWPSSWSACTAGPQRCDNGAKEGTEECDDGNTSDNDACTKQCTKNVCGDGFVYTGIESCDRGPANGDQNSCTPAYGGTCNYCTIGCRYQTKTGAFCGDNIINGNEFCDSAQIPFSCVKDNAGMLERAGTCKPEDEGKTGTTTTHGACTASSACTNPTEEAICTFMCVGGKKDGDLCFPSLIALTHIDPCADETYTDCPIGYTCRNAGVCNGETDNGKTCTVGVLPADTAENTASCTSPDTCVTPTCAGNCQTACPFEFSTASLQIKRGDSIGSAPENSIDLYSITSPNRPNVAALLIPACKVMQGIVADVDQGDIQTPESVDIVFLTDLAIGHTTLGVLVESAKEAISDFLDTYQHINKTLRIALVSSASFMHGWSSIYASCVEGGQQCRPLTNPSVCGEGDLCLNDNKLKCTIGKQECRETSPCGANDGICSMYAVVDQGFSDKKTLLLQKLDEYYVRTGVSMLDAGLNVGLTLLQSSNAQEKILIVLSDGDAYEKGAAMNVVRQSSGEPTTLAKGIKIFTAAITTNLGQISFMRHLSNDYCPEEHYQSGGYLVETFTTGSVTKRCEPNKTDHIEYAYSGSTTNGMRTMYQNIKNTILGVVLSFVTNLEGSSVSSTTTGYIRTGKAVPLPVPEWFKCNSASSILPFTVTFNAPDETINLDNFKFTYCPK